MDSDALWNIDFVELIDAFQSEGVDFIVVGAFALAQHGLSRSTGDLDVYVRPDPVNAQKVIAALKRFGAPLSAASISAKDFSAPGIVYQLGLPPRRIDILTQLTGLEPDAIFSGYVEQPIQGRQVRFLGRAALIQNKTSAARPKDLADVAQLELLAAKMTKK